MSAGRVQLPVLQQIVALHTAFLAYFARRPLSPENINGFAYGRGSLLVPFLLVATLTAPVEAGFLYLVIPGSFWWVRDLLLLASFDALILAWGIQASINRRPHVLTPDGFLIRWGVLVSHLLPYEEIIGIDTRRDRQPSGQFGVTFHPTKSEAFFSNNTTTTLSLTLRRPAFIHAWLVPVKPVIKIHLDVADPTGLETALEEKVQSAVPDETGIASNVLADSEMMSKRKKLPIAQLSLLMEIPLFVIGLLWMENQGIDWWAELYPTWSGLLIGTAIGLGGAVLSIMALLLAHRVPGLREWRKWTDNMLVPFLGNPSLLTLATVAISAGIGEEVFFRGAVQPVLGLFPTALIFAMAHIGLPRREALPLFCYTLAGGLAFGIFRSHLALWPLAMAHASLDFIVTVFICGIVPPHVFPRN